MAEIPEELPFTADNIGSEILERFSSDIYDPTAIIRELVKNAYDSYFQLERHLDLDDVDADLDTDPLVEVNLIPSNYTLIIQDKGLGLDKNDFNMLISIALTEKREVDGASGFRGIGFWSAFTGGAMIQVHSTKYGSDRQYTLTLNTKLMREMQGPGTSIGAIMNDSRCKQFVSDDAPLQEHFTQVIIRAESDSGRLQKYVQSEELMNEALVESCSRSIEYGSLYSDQIEDFYKENNIRPLRLKFMGNEIIRKMPNDVSPPKIESFELENKQVIAKVIYCSNKDPKTVSESPGIQVYRDGFPIGKPNLYSEKKRSRSDVEIVRQDLLNWHIGEVHLLHNELRPDASGENIRSGVLMDMFVDQLRFFYQRLIQEARVKSLKQGIKKTYDGFQKNIDTISKKLNNGEPLKDEELNDVVNMRTTINNHMDSTRGKVKASATITSREVYLRDDELKRQRRGLSGQLRNIERQIESQNTKEANGKAESESNPIDTGPQEIKPKEYSIKDQTKSESKIKDSSNNVVPITIVEAALDELRDLVIELLKDDEEIREDLLSGINSVVGKIS